MDRGIIILRGWLFSPLGSALGWLCLCATVTWTTIVLLSQQNEVTRNAVYVLGCWWMLALVVVQVCLPPTTDEGRLQEGLAAAGWQGALAIGTTSLVAWLAWYENGTYQNPGLGGGLVVSAAWFLSSLGFGAILVWFRGYGFAATALYVLLATTMGTVWMNLGFVFALSMG